MENQTLAGFQMGLVIKMPLFAYLAIYCFSRPKKLSAVMFWGGLYALKYIVHDYDNVKAFWPDAVEMIKALFLPLFVEFFRKKNSSPEELGSFCADFSKIGILATIPFLMGLKEFTSTPVSLVQFGAKINRFTGPFENPPDAAAFLAVALLILLGGGAFARSLKSVVMYVCLGMCALIITYTRTGYAMFVLPITMMILRLRLSRWIKITPLLLVLLLSIAHVYQSSETFRRRIRGEEASVIKLKEAGKEKDVYEQISSTRTVFWKVALEHWESSSLHEKIIGMGREKCLRLMEEALGRKWIAHNGFIDSIQVNGVLGFFFLIMLFWKMYQAGSVLKQTRYRNVFLNLYFAFFLGFFLQGSISVLVFIPFYCYLAIGLKIKDANKAVTAEQAGF